MGWDRTLAAVFKLCRRSSVMTQSSVGARTTPEHLGCAAYTAQCVVCVGQACTVCSSG